MSLTAVTTVGSPTGTSLDDIEGSTDAMFVVPSTWAEVSLVPICAETLQKTEKMYSASEQVAPIRAYK